MLGSVVARLTAELAGTRLDRANLVAAIRAALAAHADGDDDPLSYLRDELAQQAHADLTGGDRDDALCCLPWPHERASAASRRWWNPHRI
jgi:hypothetical protein